MEAGTQGEIAGSAGSKAMAGHRGKMRRAFIPPLPSQGTDSHPPASASVVAICTLGVGISRALESRGSAGGEGLGAAVLAAVGAGSRARGSGTSTVGRVGWSRDAEQDTGRENVNQLQCLPERSQM